MVPVYRSMADKKEEEGLENGKMLQVHVQSLMYNIYVHIKSWKSNAEAAISVTTKTRFAQWKQKTSKKPHPHDNSREMNTS